jgi:hypothetical protein
MRTLFGEEVAKHWKTVVTDRDFYSPVSKSYVRWKVGQPLGLLSSWGAFTLTHHFVVKYVAKSHSFSDYMVLGDDILIFNPVVAEAYKQFMSDLGVNLNLSKSFVSKDPKHVYGEFAKRVFVGMDEITALPPSLMLETRKSIYMVPEFLSFLERRWQLTIPGCELYAPALLPWLTAKGRRHLSIILGIKKLMEASEGGYPLCLTGLSREQFIIAYNKGLVQKMHEKIDRIFELSSANRDKKITLLIEDTKRIGGEPVSQSVHNSLYSAQHPLYLASLKTSSELSNQQADLWENKDQLIVPIDFIQDPLLGAFFYDRKKHRMRQQGQFILEFYHSLPKSK